MSLFACGGQVKHSDKKIRNILNLMDFKSLPEETGNNEGRVLWNILLLARMMLILKRDTQRLYESDKISINWFKRR